MRRLVLTLAVWFLGVGLVSGQVTLPSYHGVQRPRSTPVVPTLVQVKAQKCTGTFACTVTFDNPTTTGNTLLIGVSGFVTANYIVSAVDCAGAGPCTGSPVSPFVIDAGRVFTANQSILRASNITGQGQHSVTVTMSHINANPRLLAAEYSGISTLRPTIETGSADATGAASSCPLTPTAPNTLLFGLFSGPLGMTAASPTALAVENTPDTANKAFYKVVGAGATALNATHASAAWWTLCESYAASTGLVKREGYFPAALSPMTTALVQDAAWEKSAPHTLSIVDMNTTTISNGGFRFWGYYGTQAGTCEGVGLARSNDLLTWTKATTETPLTTNARWPSVVYSDGTLYAVWTSDSVTTIKLATSTDGLAWTVVKTLVPDPGGVWEQNGPTLLHASDGFWYLYYTKYNTTNSWTIYVRKAATPDGLDAASDVSLATSATVLAATQAMELGGVYYLAVETFPSSVWTTNVYASTSPDSGFAQLPGTDPFLGLTATGVRRTPASACMFQHVFDGVLHLHTCDYTNSAWTLTHRSIPVAKGRAVH